MRTTRFTLAALLLATTLLSHTPARADEDKVIFYQDPVFKPLNADDPHPMTDLTNLAEGGDVRAQFIIGDLYAKGKGGLVKNEETAAHWFSMSAINGYGASFIRLAALAKHKGDMVQAYSWYDLGADLAGGDDGRYCAKARDALKLSDEDEDKADTLSSAWRKEKAKVLRAQEEAAKLKRKEEDKAAQQAAAAIEKKTAPATTKGTARTGNADTTANKAQTTWTPSVKEKHFND